MCEDIWEPEPAQLARSAGAEMFVVLNASPFEIHKQANREDIVRRCVKELRLPVVYVNMLGGQDELVFDGNSFVMDGDGAVVMRAPPFEEGLYLVEFERVDGIARPVSAGVAPELSDAESVYRALVLGVRDYVAKHGFPGVVMGLSGGVDSALTLAIAVDALGASRVHAVMMPSRVHLADEPRRRARAGRRPGRQLRRACSIDGMMKATEATLAGEVRRTRAGCHRGEHPVALPHAAADGHFQQDRQDAADHRQQERDGRGLRHAVRRHGRRLRAHQGLQQDYWCTGWPSTAIRVSPVIPRRVIDRPPSAELRPDQKDSDSLPPYEVLDPILEAFIEDDLSVDEICARGFDRPTVVRVLDLVKRNEYKRRQAPPGVRVSRRAFGRDWRYPITSGYRR